MSISPEIVFSEDRQLALLCHMILDPKIYDAAKLLEIDIVRFHNNANAQKIALSLETFVAKHHRHPTLVELKGLPPFVNELPIVATKALQIYERGMSLIKDVPVDLLLEDLKSTRMAQVLRESVETAVTKWNRQDVSGAAKDIMDLAANLQKIDHQGVTASTYDAATWSIRERQDRADMRGKIIPTGQQFLDDAMGGGVAPTDLVLLGSKTGVGKSQLMYQIALAATAAGHRVFLLALEADPGEAQRRLKFPTIMRHYRAANPTGDEIDYVRYCHGEYTDLLAPFEDSAHEEYVRKYGSLQTLYKHSATYTSEDMERDIIRMAPNVDLILIDHLHYIDGNDRDNENVAAKKLIKKLREINQSMRKAIIAAAHVRKTDGPRKFAPLLPNVEDIMGSSDLVKVATHVILLGPTAGLDDEQLDLTAAPEIGGIPTFVRMVKSRTAGIERTQFTAVCFFKQREGLYDVNYLMGRLQAADTHWSPVYADFLPKWARRAVAWRPVATKV